MITQKVEIFVSKAKLIFTDIINKSSADSQIRHLYISEIHDVNQYSKIDLLIIDNISVIVSEEDYFWLQTKHHIKNIVNLSKSCSHYCDNNSNFRLPCRVSQLLEILSSYRKNQYIFCKINNQLLYDQQSSVIFNYDVKHHLSEKENEILTLLLTSENYRIHKQELQNIIWKYHPDIISNTIHVHLFRLKQKLPRNLLQYKDTYYQLNISNIE